MSWSVGQPSSSVTVFQRDGIAVPDEEADWPRLMPFQTLALRDQVAVSVPYGDVQFLWGRVDEHPVTGVFGVDPGAGKGEAARPRPGEPEVPGLESIGHGCIYPSPTLRARGRENQGRRRNDTRDFSRASLQEARGSSLEGRQVRTCLMRRSCASKMMSWTSSALGPDWSMR
jgi:hypothetical protein